MPNKLNPPRSGDRLDTIAKINQLCEKLNPDGLQMLWARAVNLVDGQEYQRRDAEIISLQTLKRAAGMVHHD